MVQLILKLKVSSRELEDRRDGDTSPDVDERSQSLEVENALRSQMCLMKLQGEWRKDQLNSGQSFLEIQEKRSTFAWGRQNGHNSLIN